jgi:hypothetical protein
MLDVTGRMPILILLGAVELVLILPGLTGILLLAVQWWVQHVWRYLAGDDLLNALLYPFVGAVAGVLAGVGLASGLASNGRKGVGWLVASIAVVVIGSVGPALIRRSQAGVPPRFSTDDLALEAKILAGRLYLSAAEKEFFECRAAQGRREAECITKEADRLTWEWYWRTRSRPMRFLALGSLAVGACAAGALAWLSGNTLLLVAVPSGAGLLIALDADRRLRRREGRFQSSLLLAAAAEVGKHLKRLKTLPEPVADPGHGFLKHLAFLLAEGLTQRSGPRRRSPQVPVEGPSVT